MVLASMVVGNWVWPGRTCILSTSTAPHPLRRDCGGWKFFLKKKWETHQVRSAALIGVRDTFNKSTTDSSINIICR